jgi:hypothetical protein
LVSDPVVVSKACNAGLKTSSAIAEEASKSLTKLVTLLCERESPKLSTAVDKRLAAASSAAKALTDALP